MTNNEVIKELKVEFLGESDRQREAKNQAIIAMKKMDKIDELLKFDDRKYITIKQLRQILE